MGWIHAGTNGRDFRSDNQKKYDKLKQAVADAARHLQHAERNLEAFELAQERARVVKYELELFEPTQEELDQFLMMRRKAASNYVDESSPEWPQGDDEFNGDQFLRLVRNK